MEKLPENIQAKVNDWLGAHRIVQFWEDWECNTYFVVAQRLLSGDCDLYFLRIFPIGNSYQVSQDNVFQID